MFSGDAFIPKETTWPVEELKDRRRRQNSMNIEVAKNATDGLTHSEVDMPMVGESDITLINYYFYSEGYGRP